MGFTNRMIRMLDYARESGVDYSQTAMIGRQQIHLREPEFRSVVDDCGVPNADRVTREIYDETDCFAEPLFRAWGADVVDSVDASDYEDASIVADLNQPIDSKHHNQYSCVVDGGSLEHVFNFPTAIKSCMQMTRVGGHFISVNGTNNYSGHGFYQFSPELLFRVLSPENGFEVTDMFMWERDCNGSVYRVADPAEVRSRVMPHTHRRTLLWAVARRTHEADIFATTPQQSDYSVDWAKGQQNLPETMQPQPPMLKHMGKQAEKRVRWIRRRLFSKLPPEHFQVVDFRRSA